MRTYMPTSAASPGSIKEISGEAVVYRAIVERLPGRSATPTDGHELVEIEVFRSLVLGRNALWHLAVWHRRPRSLSLWRQLELNGRVAWPLWTLCILQIDVSLFEVGLLVFDHSSLIRLPFTLHDRGVHMTHRQIVEFDKVVLDLHFRHFWVYPEDLNRTMQPVLCSQVGLSDKPYHPVREKLDGHRSFRSSGREDARQHSKGHEVLRASLARPSTVPW